MNALDLNDLIKTNKPNLSDSSIKEYIRMINILNKEVNGKSYDLIDLDFLKDIDNIEKIIKTRSNNPKTIKNYYTAILVMLSINPVMYDDLVDKYRDKVKQLNDNINDDYDENKKSIQQEKNWITGKEILDLLKSFKKQTKPLIDKFKAGETLTEKEKDLIQQYLVLYLYSGKAEDLPPVRNDYVSMKVVRNPADVEDTNNFLVILDGRKPMYFVFNDYKTSKLQGKKELVIKTKELKDLLKLWTSIIQKDFLLTNIEGTKMTANGLTKYINKIFKTKYPNKNISSSLLRAIYISENTSGINMKERKELANKMGHSVGTQEQIYTKI